MHPVGLSLYGRCAAEGALQKGWLASARAFGATHASVHRTGSTSLMFGGAVRYLVQRSWMRWFSPPSGRRTRPQGTLL